MLCETRGLEDTLPIGNSIIGDPRIVGVFTTREWEDVERGIRKIQMTGRLIVHKESRTRMAKISVGMKYTNAKEIFDKYEDIIHDMKLAIKREAVHQIWDSKHLNRYSEEVQEEIKNTVICGLIFQYPRLRQYPPKIPDDLQLVQEIELITPACLDEEGKYLPAHSGVLMGDDAVVSEKDIDLCGVNDPLTPEDPYPGRA